MPKEGRVSTAVRFDPQVHEALRETADELGVGVNWLVNKFVEQGLRDMDMTAFRLLRT